MALSLSYFLVCIFLARVGAETRIFDWNIGWAWLDPDNQGGRPVIAINGQWPPPLVNVTIGDRVIVNLHNQLGNSSTSLHFHGLFQNGTSQMDGPVGVTQCDVPSGMSMTYNFTIQQPGTYWYHSHTRGQYQNGFRGPVVIHDPENPYRNRIDKEVSLTVSDWYHDLAGDLIERFMSYANPTGAEPVPNAALINDTQNLTISVEPSTTYFMRLSNIGSFAGQYFWIEGHTLTVIEVDGVYTEPAEASTIYLGVGQRYGFLVTTHVDKSKNFPLMSSMDTTSFENIPAGLNWNVTGWLVYDDNAPKPAAAMLGPEFDALDDLTLTPHDKEPLLENVNNPIELVLTMGDLADGVNYAFFNDITYTRPLVPTLYSVLSSGDAATNATIYGDFTNTFVLNKGDVVQIALNNRDHGKHPFHLHGHNFQVVERPIQNSGDFDATKEITLSKPPMRRDVLVVKPNSHFVVRFVADNPGVWFFHCHIQWHLIAGLAAVMVEDPLAIQQNIKVPDDHYDVCKAAGTLTEGNAAGNTVDLFDLTGQPKQHSFLPAGFTARGIVALVFSCIAAFVGMAVIAWYGAAPISSAEMASAQKSIAETQNPSQ